MCVNYLLCLIVLPLPPGKNPSAVEINNNNNILRYKTEQSGLDGDAFAVYSDLILS
jgi:hypothetical protein